MPKAPPVPTTGHNGRPRWETAMGDHDGTHNASNAKFRGCPTMSNQQCQRCQRRETTGDHDERPPDTTTGDHDGKQREIPTADNMRPRRETTGDHDGRQGETMAGDNGRPRETQAPQEIREDPFRPNRCGKKQIVRFAARRAPSDSPTGCRNKV